MALEFRSIADDEVFAFRQAISLNFGGDADPKGTERFRKAMPLERTIAAFDGDEIVGNLGDYALRLTVPGGAQVAVAGTTVVGVRATHTRRGILRTMMGMHMDRAVERGEPIAALWASEPGIYGRFGFGLATHNHRVTVEGHRLAPLSDPAAVAADGIALAMVSPAQLHDLVAPFWSRVARERSGFIDRDSARWDGLAEDPKDRREGASSARHVVARRNGEVVGYLAYRQKESWTDFSSHGTVVINTLVAPDHAARRALWAYALDIDLFPNIDYWNGDVADPIAEEVSDGRAVRRVLVDALYVRILDLAAALTARTYEFDDTLVLDIADDLDYASGRIRLSIENGRATVAPTTDEADVAMGIAELGALYLGRRCAGTYTSLGRISASTDDVHRLDRMFATMQQPWCPEMF